MMHLYHPTGSTPNSSTTTTVPNIPARSPHALGHACTSCYRAKTVCDGERPCQRCKRLKREDTCMDRTARNTPAASSSHTKKEPTGHTKNSKSKANKHYDHANSNVNTSESVTPTPLNQTSTAPNPFLSQSIATSATPQLSWDNLWEISSNIDGEIWNQYPLTLGNTVAPSQQQPQGLSDSLLSPQLGTSSLLSMDSNYSNSYLPQTPTMVTSSIMPVQSNEAANPMRQSLSIEMIGTTSAPIGGIGAIMGTSSGVSGPSSMNSMGNVGNSIYSINSMVGPTLGNMNAGNMNTITLNNNLPPSSSNLPSSSIVPVANSSHVGLAGGSVPVTGLTGGSTVSVHSSTPPPNSSSSASSASTGSNSDNLPRVLTLSGDSGPTDLAVMGGLMFQNHLALNSVAIFRKQLERHESTARRLQFYFSQLSEILSCQHFHLFTKSIPVPVPLSLKAPYSKEDLLAIARADSGNPSTSTLNASSNSDSSNFVPSATVAGALPFTYVDFTWTHSPLEPLSDTLSASLAGPIAISRTRRLGPFLEKDDVWLRRKKHADSLSVLSTLEREMLTAYRHRTRAKRRARRAKAHAPSASTLTTGTSTLPHAHSRKRQRSESSNNHHLLGVNSSSVELQPSVTPASNQADAIMSPTMSNDASMHGPPGSESTTSTRKHAHLDSHHSSSDSSISDSELESDDDSSQQYLKPITIMHVATCPSFSLVEPDASTPISPDHPSTPQTCACPKVQPVEMSIQVNNEWERLFGVTQSQLREMYIKEGARAAQRFNRIDSVITAHRAKVKAILGVQNDHRYHAVIVNKWGGEIHCVVRARITYDESGTFVESVHSYMPLPDPKPPTIAQVLAAQG